MIHQDPKGADRRIEDLSPDQLDQLLRALQQKGGRTDDRIRPRPRNGSPLPLSFAQERLWFLDQFQPGSAAYNLPAAVRLRGRLHLPALARSLGEIVRRHEALRTTFAIGFAGGPVPVVTPPSAFPLPVVDLGGLGERLREKAAQRLCNEEAQRPFDLAAGPLLRSALLRLGSGDFLMLLTQHHIVSDGWSIGLFMRELGALYTAFAEGRPSPLPELPIQYADYAAWQREWLAGEVLERQIAYWRGRLDGAPALLELPADRPRPPVQSLRGGRLVAALPAAGLHALARRREATLFMVLLAGAAALLARLTGREDLALGSPIAGRSRPETADLIGFFANTLVLRADLSGDPSFGELLERVREVSLGAYAHQDLPFERLVEELAPERSLAHSPLFQVMVVLQNAPAGALELPGLQLRPAELESGVAKFDLTLTLFEEGSELAGSLDYARDLFDATTMTHWLDRLGRVLAAAASDPGLRLSELPLLSEAERQQLLEWNATGTLDEPRACLHELVEAQVARTPDAVAVELEGEALTYAELDVRANRLAHHLGALGVGPETLVGICAERSLEMVIGLLAVLKAGGAYVPLDPDHPKERLAHMIEDAGVEVLLVTERVAGRLPAHGARTVPLRAFDPELAAHPASRPAVEVDPRGLVYVIYTSGSTGRPKGAMNSHRGVVNRLTWLQRSEPLHETDAVLQKTPIGFDISVWELFWPLSCGARLVMAVPGGHQDPDYLTATVERRKITILHFVPSMLPAFLEARDLERCSGLRRVIASGEALPADLVTAFFARLPWVRLYNLYGPTEAAIEVTAWACEPGTGARAVPIGRPIDNLRIHLLDAAFSPVPAGVVGELYIGGMGVARGYVHRPDLTAERFLPEPFTAEPGSRMYRTGDLARYRADGAIEYLGRVDHQVKIRGFRIELGEIEAVLGTHPGARQAVVLARTDATGTPRLVAYVVPREGAALSAAELSRHLEASLPAYMVPASFVLLPALPLNPNGKVDRKALPDPERERPAGSAYVAPRTEAQATLVQIWRELLPVESIGIHDNFFELGGNSLKVMQLRSRLRSALGPDLPLTTFFEAQTIARQAEQAERALRASGGAAPPPLKPFPLEGDPPLSFSQERLWFLDQLEPGSPVYNLPAGVLLEGELEPSVLRWALARIVERHAVLRTTMRTMRMSVGRPVQVVAPRLDLPLPWVDLEALAAGAQEAEVDRLALAEALASFDLAVGPLLRATLLRLGRDRHVLLLTFHHIVTDGWSLGVFFEERTAPEAAARAGQEPGSGALPVQYADFALWQRQWLQGEELDRLLAYWRERLAAAPAALELPFDRPRPAVQTYRGTSQTLELGPGTAASLRAFGRKESTTLFMTLLAACATVLHRLTGQRDLVLGTPTANRDQVEIERLIGFFANSLALRMDLAGDPPFRDFLGRMRAAVLADYAHQEIPFEKLVEDLRPERDLSHNPIYQVVFALESSERDFSLDLPGLRLTPRPAVGGTAKFDLALYMEDRGGRLTGLLETNRDLFDPATGARWLGHFRTLVEAVLEDPGRRLSELPLLAPSERHQLLFEANDTRREPPRELFVHRLFEARAADRPDAPAVSQEGRRLTYGELNRRANQLARRLRSLGVGPETRVAVSVERSPELIVALLGVLKAGGAYVPLDPTYPQERLAFLLADSRASVLLTQETLAARFDGIAPATLLLDAGWQEFTGEETDDLAVPMSPGSLAYVIYTSGSTGRPKGVMIEHRSLASYTATASQAYGIEPADRVLQFCSISFDISIEEIVPCLTHGAELVLRTEAMIESIATFLAVCRERSLSVLSLPTAYWHEITARVEAESLELPPSLRLVIIAGERALPERLAAWRRHAPERPRLVNTYGLTESTIISTLADLTASPGFDGARGAREVPIGRTIPDTEVYLLDRGLEPVPLGAPGEIHLGGGLLARGYFHRPDVTAERFVPHVFARVPGARLYRTGDLGRRLPGGDLEFLGRGDHQVKIRGYRIELGEIETALAEHPAVADAAVTVREDRPGQKRLVAYLATRPTRPVESLEELRAFLRRRLPDYMLPATFVFLEAMPLTPNGKVDRGALPAPQGGRPELAAEYVPPSDETELAIAAIWQEALGLERVGLHDNFFDLGGHSLLLIQIHDRLRERFGRSLPMVELFKHPTVGALARYLDESSAGSPAAEAWLPVEIVQDRAARSRAAVRQERYLKARRRLQD